MAAAVQRPVYHPHGHQRPSPVGPFNPEKKHSEPERWICIYPAYINSLKTKSEGRLLAKAVCVPNPTWFEIKDVLATVEGVNWTPIVENKQYPRERSRENDFRGRIRVQLRNDDGSLFSESFPTRESVLKYLCEKIPQLKSRTAKQSGQTQESTGGSGGGGSGAGAGGNKKGKKKK